MVVSFHSTTTKCIHRNMLIVMAVQTGAVSLQYFIILFITWWAHTYSKGTSKKEKREERIEQTRTTRWCGHKPINLTEPQRERERERETLRETQRERERERERDSAQIKYTKVYFLNGFCVFHCNSFRSRLSHRSIMQFDSTVHRGV